MKTIFVALFVVALLMGSAVATIGVDVSQRVSESDWNCLAGQGFNWGVSRVWRSTGEADPNAAANLIDCANSNVQYCDGYLFPCPHCGHTEAQAQDAVKNLKASGASFGTIWLDIEGPQYWTDSVATNRQVFEDLVNGLKSEGANVGVYTSQSQWCPIMGCDYTGGSAFPLWYAHYDGTKSFSDFSPFGGWSSPHAKQYGGDETYCGVGVDIDWFP